jgi:Flp pilus assembly protein TadB
VADQLGAAAAGARLETGRSTPTVACRGTSIELRFAGDSGSSIDDVIQQMRKVIAMHDRARELRRKSAAITNTKG